MRYEVTMKYNPGVPVKYIIEDAVDHWAARAQVRELIGYDPGVPLEIRELPLDPSAPIFKFFNLGHGERYC